jgi:hypothetical protein
VPTNKSIGIAKGNSTDGGAILLSQTFKHGFSLPVRSEYITSKGSATDPDVVNLMYGSGSGGTSVTVTPTFQYRGLFFRGDISFVHATNYIKGSGFGPAGLDQNQTRVVAEIGFIFGNNIVEKKP